MKIDCGTPPSDLGCLRKFEADVCPHCGAISVYLSVDAKRCGCWQGHSYPNVKPTAHGRPRCFSDPRQPWIKTKVY